MKEDMSQEVRVVISKYPEHIQKNLLELRQLVFEVAVEVGDVADVEETLKWGEPSYLRKGGSTLRFDWKPSKPKQYAMFVNCKTRMIETFREFYGDVLTFEGNRAIIFDVDDKVPTEILKHCIKIALTYHRVKHFPTLGI
ncbi:MAG: DUF1801 domain-containing protein [Ghiorsea sp.]